MSYPLGDDRVRDVRIYSVLDDPLGGLQDQMDALGSQELLRVLWSPDIDNTVGLYDSLAEFHRWMRDDLPLGSGYVLHFLPNVRQKGRLHSALCRCEALAVTWNGQQLALVGTHSKTLHGELVRIVAALRHATPPMVYDAVSMEAEYDEGYISTELGHLARHRVVGRHRRKGYGGQIGRSGRPSWTYFPLWTRGEP